MAYGTIMQQLLQDPERVQEGVANAIVEDIEELVIQKIREQTEPQIREAVKERIQLLRVHLTKEFLSSTFSQEVNINAFFEKEKIA
jgi:hypothetical protein